MADSINLQESVVRNDPQSHSQNIHAVQNDNRGQMQPDLIGCEGQLENGEMQPEQCHKSGSISKESHSKLEQQAHQADQEEGHAEEAHEQQEEQKQQQKSQTHRLSYSENIPTIKGTSRKKSCKPSRNNFQSSQQEDGSAIVTGGPKLPKRKEMKEQRMQVSTLFKQLIRSINSQVIICSEVMSDSIESRSHLIKTIPILKKKISKRATANRKIKQDPYALENRQLIGQNNEVQANSQCCDKSAKNITLIDNVAINDRKQKQNEQRNKLKRQILSDYPQIMKYTIIKPQQLAEKGIRVTAHSQQHTNPNQHSNQTNNIQAEHMRPEITGNRRQNMLSMTNLFSVVIDPTKTELQSRNYSQVKQTQFISHKQQRVSNQQFEDRDHKYRAKSDKYESNQEVEQSPKSPEQNNDRRC